MLGSELIQFREAELIARGDLRAAPSLARAPGDAVGHGHACGGGDVYLARSGRLPPGATAQLSAMCPRQWKAVTRGLPITSATAQTYALQSENLRPWPAASLRLEQSGR